MKRLALLGTAIASMTLLAYLNLLMDVRSGSAALVSVAALIILYFSVRKLMRDEIRRQLRR
jgi:hypothetical protein